MPNKKTKKSEALLHLESLRQLAEEKTFKEGEYIFKQGQHDPHFYVVLEGEIEISIQGSKGKDKAIAYIREGELLGEGVLSGKDLKPVSARAIKPLKVLSLSHAHFKKLADEHSQEAVFFLLQVLGLVNNRLNRTNIKLVSLFELNQMMHAHRDDLKGMGESLIKELLHLARAEDGILVLRNPFSDELRTICSTSPTLNEVTVRRYDLTRPQCATDINEHILIVNLKEAGAIVLTRPLKSEPFNEDHLRLIQLIAEHAANIIDETSRRAAEKARTLLHQKRYTL